MLYSNVQGPCLPWCFTYYEDRFMLIGFLFGCITGIIIILSILSFKKKEKKERKKISQVF